VIGSGIMGQGIAQASAVAGFDVELYDIDQSSLEKAIISISANLSQLVSKGKIDEGKKGEILKRLHTVRSLDELRGELVIEAIVEKLNPKQELLAALESKNRHAILATNTSTFPVSQVAAKLKDPTRCVGLHFFNPAHVMKLVEVIAGPATSPSVVQSAVDFVKSLQKVPVLANDTPGFIVNRVARSFYLEALKLLEENAASKETIDELMRGTGFKMGPFELMDLIGLDTNLAVTESLYEAFDKPERFRPSNIQIEMVSEKRLGVKTRKGFYDYPR
jgi:3-hydroxybutyryl-CoA dehydrogenase